MDKCIQFIEEECESFKNRIEEEFESFKNRIEEEVELAKNRSVTRIKSFFKDGNQTSPRTNMKLKFRNSISQTILTGEEIKGEGNTSLEVVVVDDHTGDVVTIGPEASASVQIVLLKGDSDSDNLTVEEFERNIVPEVNGKRPLLDGNLVLKLQGGVGVPENIKLRHDAIKIKPSVFKLGARVVDSSDRDRIREAQTESFAVKDFRIKFFKKHETPAPSDVVSRLVNIRRYGKIEKRLKENKINTVEDFLLRLLIDPKGLKKIVNLATKKWEDMVKNARACSSDKKVYFYVDSDKKMCVVFNVLGQVLELYSTDQYFLTSLMPENYKADAGELLASAYKHWGNVKPFDDMNSLQQHLSSLSTSLDYPGGGYEKNGTEMIGESSSRLPKFSWHSASSTMNSMRETCGEKIIVHDAGVQLSPYFTFGPATMSPDLDYINNEQNGGYNMQFSDLINESNADAATRVTFAESEVVQTPKRWKTTLFCVSRLFWVKKMASLKASHKQKKQKVG